MKERGKEIVLRTIGAILIFIGGVSIFYSIFDGRPEEIIWLCYIGALIMGFGFLLRKDYLVISQFIILLIPLIIWDIDFVFYFIKGESFFGIADYFFYTDGIANRLISLQHILVLPLMVLGVYFIEWSSWAWKLSLGEMGLIFVLGRLFTSESLNMNCVFRNCLPFSVGSYEIVWFVVVIFGVLLINFIGRRVFSGKMLRR